MSLYNSPEIFQENMSELFLGLYTVRVYINDLLHVTKGYRKEHLTNQRKTAQSVLSLTLENLTNVSYINRIPYLRSKISY